ncbi:serine hydrolase domain-containing protein [Nocardia inohanensis]|uniref:serine hydrolase domain-containing protein n=1 Tax=Nocardia inohanensis TaxID=209246 RepID=UPI00083516F3|nr:serine hydrolase domain-containing protein [Nocardia inohanensis]
MRGQVSGHTDPAFQGVRDVFAASFADGQNLGAGVAVYAGGRLVVDLWGGIADKHTGRAWERETPVVGFSCTKAVTATAALRVAADTGIAMDDPVARWWPEYACAGKESTTTADFFTHSAGLPVIDRPVTAAEAADPELMAEYLAAQSPLWEPGSEHGYHAMSYGWLTGEIVRRRTGLTVGDYTRRHLSPDLHIGAPAPMLEQIARLSFPPAEEQVWQGDPAPIDAETVAHMTRAFQDPNSLIRRSAANPRAAFGQPEVLTGGWPAVGLVTTPRALATFYRDLVAGVLLPPQILRDAIRERVRGIDQVLRMESAYALGYTLPAQNMIVPESARPTVFGHPGAGGAIGLGDPENQVALAFMPNLRRDWLAGDRRAYQLIEAVYEAL